MAEEFNMAEEFKDELEDEEETEEETATCRQCDKEFSEDDAVYIDGETFCCEQCAGQYLAEKHGLTECEVCEEKMIDCDPSDLDRDEKDAIEAADYKVPEQNSGGHGYCKDCNEDTSICSCENCGKFRDANSDDGFFVDAENLEEYYCSDCLDSMTAHSLASAIQAYQSNQRARQSRNRRY